MIQQHAAIKISSTKLLSAIISPSLIVLALGGIILWKFRDNKQEIREIRENGLVHQKTLDAIHTKIEALSTPKKYSVPSKKIPSHKTSTSKLAFFKQILQNNLDLRKATV